MFWRNFFIIANSAFLVGLLSCFLIGGELGLKKETLFLWAVLLVFVFLFFKKRKKVRVIIFFLFFFVVGFSRLFWAESFFNQGELLNFNNQEVIGFGSLGECQRKAPGMEECFLSDLEINKIGQKENIDLGRNKHLLVLFYNREKEIGEDEFFRVGFRGQLVIPEDFGRSLSGAERTSLFKRQAVGILKNHRFDFLYPEKKEFSLNHFFSILREKVFNSSRQFWEDDNLGLALAFLTGDKSQLSLELKKIINCLGLAHLIAVSGMQFTSLGFLLEAGLFFLNFPHKVRFYLIMAVLLFFLLFIGAPAAASRAFLMDFLNRLAVRCGRKITFWASFLFSASLLLLFNPWSLFYDLGFLFSFFAIWGLYFFGDFFRIQSLPTALQESLALNLAAQTATAPLALFYFPYFSPLSVVVNLLVGWLAIPLIVLSFGALLLAPLFLPLAELLSSCATCLVFYFVLILEKIKSISWSCLSLENNMFWAGVFFAVVALLAFGLKIFNLKEKNEKDRFFSVG